MSQIQTDGAHMESKLEDPHSDLYGPTFDQELFPSLGMAIVGVAGAYVLVWLVTLPFARL
jgi:hypothetical protein